MRFLTQRRRFKDLTEQEVLALAISSEEDDAQIYRNYAQQLRAEFPDTAKIFEGMAREEDGSFAELKWEEAMAKAAEKLSGVSGDEIQGIIGQF